jgi:hypothetical protein
MANLVSLHSTGSNLTFILLFQFFKSILFSISVGLTGKLATKEIQFFGEKFSSVLNVRFGVLKLISFVSLSG